MTLIEDFKENLRNGMKKKILVTGGAGFIGSNLVEELIKKDFEVIILDNLSSGYKRNLLEFSDKITFIEGDILDYDLVSKLMDEVSVVYHLAAMVSVPISLEKPEECFKLNVLASINLMDECIKHNAKFIFASSAAVYGNDKTEIKSENINTIPISPYGISKLDVERLCDIYRLEKGLKYTCFRNFNVYGPKQDIKSSYAAVIPSFINKALINENLIIFGEGTQTRDFIYVVDVVSAYIMAMGDEINGVFNLGCNDIMDILGLAKFILEKTKSNSKIIFKEGRKGDIKHSRASSEKYLDISNWSIKVDLDKGLDKTVEYYEND